MIEDDSPIKVKVCGVTEADHAIGCAEAGADWIGLNFHPPSPRSITPERGARIVGALHASGKGHPVALFVNRPVVEVARTLRQIGPIRTIQLHGDEPPEYLLEWSAIEPTLQIVRAFRLSDEASVARMTAYLERAERLGCPPYAVLVDAHVAGQAGGTGRTIPVALLDLLPDHPRLILAGGLDASNVAERAGLVRPWMVDVAGGVESAPGLKDLAKVEAFVAALRGVSTTSPRNAEVGR